MTNALRARIVTTLDDYAELLDSGIEAHTVPGTDQAVPCEQEILDDLRSRRSEVEAIKAELEGCA